MLSQFTALADTRTEVIQIMAEYAKPS